MGVMVINYGMGMVILSVVVMMTQEGNNLLRSQWKWLNNLMIMFCCVVI